MLQFLRIYDESMRKWLINVMSPRIDVQCCNLMLFSRSNSPRFISTDINSSPVHKSMGNRQINKYICHAYVPLVTIYEHLTDYDSRKSFDSLGDAGGRYTIRIFNVIQRRM